MFDPEEAFRNLNGQSFTQAEFRRALEGIRAASLRYLPAEFETRDLAALAYSKRWLKPESHGRLRVMVGQQRAPKNR